MSKRALQPLPPAADQAVVFICQKCGKRAGDSHRKAGRELAKAIKGTAKHEFGRRGVRAVMTSCMKLCPKGGITVCVQRQQGQPAFLRADIEQLEGAVDEVLKLVKQR